MVTRRCRITRYGRHLMGASPYLREDHFPNTDTTTVEP